MSTAVDTTYGMKHGTPAIRSLGALAFSPDGILFAADNRSATIFAFDFTQAERAAHTARFDVKDLDTLLAAYLGCPREEVFIRDLAVHPRSGRVYLSVMRGAGENALPVLLTVDPGGTLADVALRDLPFAQAPIENAPDEDDARKEPRLVQGTREGSPMEPRPGWKLQVAFDQPRTVTVTDMAFVDGALLVAGMSNEEFSSTLRRIPFPFTGPAQSSSLEIYHVSHAKYETASPIRTFLPYRDHTGILAAYTCTPVVHFPLKDFAPGAQLKGRTVAELGAGNTPLDMVSFSRDGEEHLLVSNARHPLMALKRSDVERQAPLTEPQEPVGVPRRTLPQQGVSHMANLNDRDILMLQMDESERYHLRSYATAGL